MALYGIRVLLNGAYEPLSVLAQTSVSGGTGNYLSSKRCIEIDAAITLTTGRKTYFASPDLPFVAELFLSGDAIDWEEFFEFRKSTSLGEEYEVFNFLTGHKVELDLDHPDFAETKQNIEFKRANQHE